MDESKEIGAKTGRACVLALVLAVLLGGLPACAAHHPSGVGPDPGLPEAPGIEVLDWLVWEVGARSYVLLEMPIEDARDVVARSDQQPQPRVIETCLRASPQATTILVALPETYDPRRPPRFWLEGPGGLSSPLLALGER